MDKNRIYMLCDKIAMVLMCILVADLCVFGAGKVIAVGPISFRIAVLCALGVFSLPAMLRNFKNLIRNPVVWMVVGFMVWICVSFVLGLRNGNRFHLIMTDVKGFMYFVFLPVFLSVVTNKKRVHLLMKVMMYGAAALSFIAIALLILHVTDLEACFRFSDWGYEVMFSRLSYISVKIPRLFFHSELYLLCGCAFSIYFHVIEPKSKIGWQYVVITGLCLFALMLSFTRSVYLAVAVCALGVIVSMIVFREKRNIRKLLSHIAIAAVVCICLSSFFSMIFDTGYLRYAVSRTLVGVVDVPIIDKPTQSNPDAPSKPTTPEDVDKQQQIDFNKETEASDELRAKTIRDLWINIRKAPITGIGLGAEIPSRPDGLNEYIYLDIWSKSGIIGLILYFMPMLWGAVSILRTGKDDDCDRCVKAVWMSLLLGFCAYSIFNPYMNAALGILLYCCTLAVIQPKISAEVTKGELA